MSEILKSEMMKGELRRVAKLLEEWAGDFHTFGLNPCQIQRVREESNKIYAFLGRIETD